jgi:hypothetical protein
MHKIQIKHLNTAGNLFERHIQNGHNPKIIDGIDHDYVDLLRDGILKNGPIRKADLSDIHQSQDYQLANLASYFEMFSEQKEIKDYYLAKYLQTACFIENQVMATTQWLLKAITATSRWNYFNEKYMEDKIDLFNKTIEVDTLLSIREEFLLEKDPIVTIIAPEFFNNYKNKFNYK